MASRFGPLIDPFGATFRLWAPGQANVSVVVEGKPPVTLTRIDHGFLAGRVNGAKAGDRYMFEIDNFRFPDPASRMQAEDADGWSVVVAPWAAKPPSDGAPWYRAIIAEVHVGTATPEGTFAALMQKLEHYKDAGYTTIELLPVNEFPGSRNWGYDGTLIFAPEHSYGTPEDLRALVDRAHELNLCMVQDVVYNHFGSVDGFIGRYAPEWFDQNIVTPWGAGVDFTQPMVRQFYYENAQMWLRDYDFDGLRFDAVHEIKSDSRDQFLGELASAAREVKPGARLIIENVRNNAHWLTRDEDNQPVDYCAQWNDDIHHVLNFLVTDETKDGYDDPDRDPVADLEKSLIDGFIHDGDVEGKSDGRTRHEPASLLPPDSFISCVQNHDQIGNRADSKRLIDRVDADRIDFAHFLLLLGPQIPMFFMGEEAHLQTPFPFFVDVGPEDGEVIRKGREEQMASMFKEDLPPGGLPDPNDPATFEMAKIDWSDFAKPRHRKALARFKELTALRRQVVWPLAATPCLDARSSRQGNGLIVTWVFEAGSFNMALNPCSDPTVLDCETGEIVASSGDYQQDGGSRLTLQPWTALVWASA